jgi:hypothetical protein
MKKNVAVCLTLALLGPALAGCKTHSATTPLGGGYEEVTHPVRNFSPMDEPEPPRVSLEYKGTNDVAIPIWPSLYGVNEIIHGQLAIFVGDKAYIESDRVTHPRLFAVKWPDLPLDITDQVLRRWSRANGKNLNTARDRLNLITPEENDDGLLLRLDFVTPDELSTREDWPDRSALTLTWGQIDEIMSTVKTNGIPEKDLRWGTSYIGETSKR